MRSRSSSSSGAATSRATTPTGRCPMSTPTSTAVSRSPAAACATTRTHSPVAAKWRAIAEAKHLSIRELVIEMTARSSFVGSPETVATKINDYVQADAADGYILVPHLTPHGIDRFVDDVVPILQERGVFRADYDGPTLRDHLGLRAVCRPSLRARRSRSRSSAPARPRRRCSSASPRTCPSCFPTGRCRSTSSTLIGPERDGCGDPTSTPCSG